MKLVPEHINEAIKHLTGKSQREWLESYDISKKDIENLIEFTDLMKLLNIVIHIDDNFSSPSNIGNMSHHIFFGNSYNIDHFSGEYGYSLNYNEEGYQEYVKKLLSRGAIEKTDLNNAYWNSGFVLEKLIDNFGNKKRANEYISFKTPKEVFAFIVKLKFGSIDDEIQKQSQILNNVKETLDKLNKAKSAL